MRTLKFAVNAQKITPDPNCDFSGIVPGTAGYLKAHFTFSSEWAGMVKVAEFRSHLYDEPVVPVPIINNECMVPSEVTGGKAWYIKVIGKRGNVLIPTGNCRVRQEG